MSAATGNGDYVIDLTDLTEDDQNAAVNPDVMGSYECQVCWESVLFFRCALLLTTLCNRFATVQCYIHRLCSAHSVTRTQYTSRVMKSFTSFNRKTETNASLAKPKICIPSNETWHRDNNLKMGQRTFVCHEMFIRNTHIKFWTILGAGFGTTHNRRKAARVLQ